MQNQNPGTQDIFQKHFFNLFIYSIFQYRPRKTHFLQKLQGFLRKEMVICVEVRNYNISLYNPIKGIAFFLIGQWNQG